MNSTPTARENVWPAPEPRAHADADPLSHAASLDVVSVAKGDEGSRPALAPAHALLVPSADGGDTGARWPFVLPEAAVDLSVLRMSLLSADSPTDGMLVSYAPPVAGSDPNSLSRTTQYAATQSAEQLRQLLRMRNRADDDSPVSAQGYDDAAATSTGLFDALGYSFSTGPAASLTPQDRAFTSPRAPRASSPVIPAAR